MKRALLLAAVLVSAMSAGGCSRGISEALGAVRGPKGVVTPIKEVDAGDPNALEPFVRFVLEDFDDNTAQGVPPQVERMLPIYFGEQLAERGLPDKDQGRTLIVRGSYIYYEDADEVLDQVFGPFEELLAQVRLVDGDTGEIVGEAYVVGRTDESVNRGPEEKALGLARGVVDWIAASHPASREQ